MITWIDDDPPSKDFTSFIKETLRCDIHPAALKHLSGDTVSKRIPFPRLEKHVGYLFGIIYIPANTENPSADFDAIILLRRMIQSLQELFLIKLQTLIGMNFN